MRPSGATWGSSRSPSHSGRSFKTRHSAVLGTSGGGRREPTLERRADAVTNTSLGGLLLRVTAGPGSVFLRKEVIQPQVPLRLPCYDLVPITGFIFGACLAAPATSDTPRFGGLTGGVYKAQEHIHRGMLIRDY